MLEKTKAWIEKEYLNLWKYQGDPSLCMTRCYGVTMFVGNELLNETDRDELFRWWEDYMLPGFRSEIAIYTKGEN